MRPVKPKTQPKQPSPRAPPQQVLNAALQVIVLAELFTNLFVEVLRAERHAAISPPQFRALDTLARHPGLSITALAKALGVRKPTASVMVARLQAMGLASRAAADRRRVTLALTDEGARVYGAIVVALVNRLEAGLSALSVSERAAFDASAKALQRALAESIKAEGLKTPND